MTKIYFSNTSTEIPTLRSTIEVDVPSGTLEEILDKLNQTYPGIKPFVVDEEGRIKSRAIITKNVISDNEFIFLDKEKSKTIRSSSEIISDDDNLLISIFDLEFIKRLIDEALIPTTSKFQYCDDTGKIGNQAFRGFVLPFPESKFEVEQVRDFVNSEQEINQLTFSLSEDENFMHFVSKSSDITLDRFDRQKCRVIPSPLISAMHELFGDSSSKDNKEVHLRLFQEDALFFILAKLWKPSSVPERALLLSMPTGGGKTEAFVFPLVSHLLARKAEIMKSGALIPHSVKALILYPTKALANDQAKRLAEIIHQVNQSIVNEDLPPDLGISIGIFTGDTQGTKNDLRDPLGNFLSLFQTCPVCDQSDFELDTVQINSKDITVQSCKVCGHKMSYVRVTRSDIFNAPPDILITNPDTINYHMQLPGRQDILLKNAELIIFDEVHEYNGIFGCNVAHLLRRIETIRKGIPPFYVGLSATIGNAKSLAALLFNVPPEDVLYIRHTENRPYLQPNKIARNRYHFLLVPNMNDPVKYLRSYPMTATINFVSALGHAIRDPQFRKILVFSNFKADHDKLSFQIPENERDYVRIYRDDLRLKIKNAQAQNEAPNLDKTDRAVVRQISRWFEWEKENITFHDPVLSVGWHRGALEMEERVRAVNRFSSLCKITTGDEAASYQIPTDVMVATKTLELGVDIGSVTTVINSSSPFSNNDYVQRIGRGGRRKDSLAITIINPNNAIDAYMREHFNEYVRPTMFEDAPIIASNEIIMRTHVLARILDYFANVITTGNQITVGDWIDHEIPDSGHMINVTKDPDRYAELLFNEIFPGETFTQFTKWFEIEAQALNGPIDDSLEPYNLTSDWVISAFRNACEKLKIKTDKSTKNAWDKSLPLTGYGTVFPELRPSLRGSGKSVGLYLKKRNEDEWKDEISRDRAIYQNPPGSYQSQGRNLFVIDSLMSEDKDKEDEIADLLMDYPVALESFKSDFPTSSLQNDRSHRWRFITPEDFRVRHFPARYVCSNPKCGLTYTSNEVTDNLNCLDCGRPLEQITRIYRCPQCNSLTEPPIPRICLNPECIRKKLDKDQHGMDNPKWNLRIAIKKVIGSKDPGGLRGFFRFKSRPNLSWECMDCHSVFSLHDRTCNEKFGIPQKLESSDLDGPNAHIVIAWFGLYRPELPIMKKQAYLDLGYRLNGFDCPDIDHCKAQWRGGLRAVNLPRFQTDTDQFIIGKTKLGPSKTSPLGEVYFFGGDIVTMAERYAMSDPKEDDDEPSDITRHKIFEDGSLYATKFSPHMMGIKIRKKVDEFLENVACPAIGCDECSEIANLELGDIYRPSMALTKNLVEDGKPVHPDPRVVWCDFNRAGNCTSINCSECEHFDFNSLRRFVILHTIKHGILWALPKYTGLDVGSFKGIVNPGFFSSTSDVPEKLDIIIVDTNDGGSGAIYLVNRWWESHIVPMAMEILDLASLSSSNNRRANLNLPYSCSWFNKNLCPVLTGKFIRALREGL